MLREDRADAPNFNRPPRIHLPALNDTIIDLPAPPVTPPLPEQHLLITLLPVLGIGVMALFYVGRATFGGTDSLFFAVPMALLAGFTIGGAVLAQRWRRTDYQRRRRENESNYIATLHGKRARLQAARDAHTALLGLNYPPPRDWLIAALTRSPRLWERRPTDGDFAALRVGLGQIPPPVEVQTPAGGIESELLELARALADEYRLLDAAPVTLSLRQYPAAGVCGKRTVMLRAVRALLGQLAAAHTPSELRILLAAPREAAEDWRWLEWLPHTAGSLAFGAEAIRNLMGGLSQTVDERRGQRGAIHLPQLVLIVDQPQWVEAEAVYRALLREGGQVGAAVLCLVGTFDEVPGDCRAVIDLLPDGRFRLVCSDASGQTTETLGDAADGVSAQDAEHLARALASVVMREAGSGGRIPRRVDFLNLYNASSADDLAPALRTRWRRLPNAGALPFPITIGAESLAVRTELLLNEEHDGAHGILAGTTGSGKSELLQAMICSMVLEHDPRLLNLLLIDFKGGTAFNAFADLPHTVGLVTNLDGTLVERTLEALRSEVQARQEFLKQVNAREITQYHRQYTRSVERLRAPDYRPLPHLFIIVDEFAQLAKEMPGFLRELVRIAQVGRGLGLHLILGTQSPMDVITDEMNANMQFRICLRVANAEASRAVLRRPDAAYLPANQPGRGFFQVGEQGVFKQFQAAHVSALYHPDADPQEVLQILTERGAIDLLPRVSPRPLSMPDARGEYTVTRAVVDAVIAYAEYEGITRMKPLLLPPLREKIALRDAFSAALAPVGTQHVTPIMGEALPVGWTGEGWRPHLFDVGSAPVGRLDDVYARAQPALWLHLNASDTERRKDGHVLVLGGSGSGKTALIRTLALSLALLHPPDKLHLYFLSFTGTGLSDTARLPHAERLIQGSETERIRRLFGRLIGILNERQAGKAPIDPLLVLAIDQYEQFRDTCRDSHMSDFERLVNEGRAAGIYLVITASTITAVPDRVRSLIQQRIALQLTESTDYLLAVGRSVEETHFLPGRGLIYSNPPLTCQIALPTLDLDRDERDLIQSMRAACNALYTRPPGPAPIRELPTYLPLHTLAQPDSRDRLMTALGRSDDDALTLYMLDWWASGPHFVVTGPPSSGKTNLLHTAVLSAALQRSPQELRFLLVDFNGRSFRQLAGLNHVIARVTTPDQFRDQVARLDADLHAHGESMPITALMIDDYDAFAEAFYSSGDVFAHLRDLVRLYGERPLHVWTAGYLERTGDPFIRQLLLKRAGFALVAKDGLQRLNARTTGVSSDLMPEGRMFVAQDHTVRVVQTALVEEIADYVALINRRYRDQRAAWSDAPAAPPRQYDPEPPRGDLDIDTAGLIDDLLRGADAEN